MIMTSLSLSDKI